MVATVVVGNDPDVMELVNAVVVDCGVVIPLKKFRISRVTKDKIVFLSSMFG